MMDFPSSILNLCRIKFLVQGDDASFRNLIPVYTYNNTWNEGKFSHNFRLTVGYLKISWLGTAYPHLNMYTTFVAMT